MSKNSQGGSESQDIDFDDDLIEINVNGQFEEEAEFEVAIPQNSQNNRSRDQHRQSQNVENNNQQNDNQIIFSQENLLGSLEQNNPFDGAGAEGDLISFREDVVEDQDNQNGSNKSNHSSSQQEKQLSSSQIRNVNQFESSYIPEEEISGLNIFQRNHLQTEFKKLSAKKDEGGSIAGSSQGYAEDKKVDSQVLYNYSSKSGLNYNFEQEFDNNNLLNYQDAGKQNIFQQLEPVNQQESKFNYMDNQYSELQQEQHDNNIPQKQLLHNQVEEAIKDDEQESSNLLEMPVFESEKNEDDQGQEQKMSILNQQTHISEDENEDDDDDDDDDDIDLLKNIANNSNIQQQSKKSQEFELEKEQNQAEQTNEIQQQLNEHQQQLNEQQQEINSVSNFIELKDTTQVDHIEEEKQEGIQNKTDLLYQNIEHFSDNQEASNSEQNQENKIQQIKTTEEIKQKSNEALQQSGNGDSQIMFVMEKIFKEQEQQETQKEKKEQEEQSIEKTPEQNDEDKSRRMEVEIEEKPQADDQENETEQEQEGKRQQNDQIIQENTEQEQRIEQTEQQQEQQKISELKQTEQIKEKSICEAPQTIANIFQQLANVFQNMIIPQSMINMSLHNDKLIETQPEQFQTSASVQQQINQLQNQVTYIQNSVVHIPTHLQEVTNLLTKATTQGIAPSYITTSTLVPSTSATKIASTPSSSVISKAAPSTVSIPSTTSKPVIKKDEPEKPKKGAEKSKKKKEESSEEEESEEENESSEEEQSGSDEEEESEDEIQDLKSLSSKFSNNKSSKIGSGTLSSSKGSSLNFGSLSKKTSYIQPKVGFSAPKIITPTKGLTSSFGSSKPEVVQEPQLDNITINAASIGFKEPKLFINESDRIVKSDDLEIEDESLKSLYEYFNKLDQPTSFLLIKEQFPSLTDEQIHTIIHDFKSEDKIGLVELFLPRYAKCNSARIDYYYVDMIIPPPKPKQVEPEITEEQKENTPEKIEMKIENIGDRKKYESMSDEQLLSYQKELNLRKQALLDKKQNANPTSDRLKKIQQWNEMKEVCSTVFERIAVLKGKRIQEICDDFGVKLED